MTATVVNGLTVIEAVEAHSPLSKPGKPVYFRQILELLLEDGTVVYGCIHCEYTTDGALKVRSHLGKHADSGPRYEDYAETTLSELVTKAALYDQLMASRAEADAKAKDDATAWKARALAAEADLRKVREALKVLNPS